MSVLSTELLDLSEEHGSYGPVAVRKKLPGCVETNFLRHRRI